MPPPRRVLIVAYYFPPMGMSGVQRIAKFAKYLPDAGWLTTVLTIEPRGYFAYDASLLEEVRQAGVTIIRTASIDPTRAFGKKKTVSLPGESTRRRLSVLSQLLFVPDNKVGWIPYALRAGKRELRARPYDAILATAPPYTALLVGDRLSAQSGLPLVLDFRDDWLGNPRHSYASPLHRVLHRRLERRVVSRASAVIAINQHILEGIQARNGGEEGKTDFLVLPQGFDPADFSGDPGIPPERKLRLVYSGVFYDAQTPDVFLRGLKGFLERTPEAHGSTEAVFVGLVPDASKRLITSLGLSDHVTLAGYVPHREAVRWLQRADVLWMTVGRRPGAEGISTSKLFEYMGAEKPILALVPEGEARRALAGYGASYLADPDEAAQVCSRLEQIWAAWKQGALPQPTAAYIEAFDRRVLAQRLADVLAGSSHAAG